VIEAVHLTKRFGAKTAVDDLSFRVRPGVVTGFLGPNGAGKSTTMRLILGLDLPTAGSVTVNGKRFADHRAPLHEVGALLEARAFHTGRTARNHLLALAATHKVPRSRVDELVGLVGLEEVAGKRTGGFSLGMGQRLGLAAALLGDPATLLLDEPVNGLDPEGILWIRTLLKALAAEGRTVFVSSHLMNEMAVTADHVIVVGRGRRSPSTPSRRCATAPAASCSKTPAPPTSPTPSAPSPAATPSSPPASPAGSSTTSPASSPTCAATSRQAPRCWTG
jgi:ABC-2 type transport system ATP-binding protein